MFRITENQDMGKPNGILAILLQTAIAKILEIWKCSDYNIPLQQLIPL